MPTLKAKIDGVWTEIGFGGGGSGGGTDEVWVGPDDPVTANPAVELWVDTDEPDMLGDPNVARWNSAWGVVVPPIYTDFGVAAGPSIIATIPVTTIAGRRYVLRMTNIGTYIANAAAGDTFSILPTIDGAVIVTNPPVSVDYTGNYIPPSTIELDFVAATGAHTITISVVRNSGVGQMQARYGIAVEDRGPVTMSSPPPPAPADAWTPLTFENGWFNLDANLYTPGSHRMVGDRVELRGLVKGLTVPSVIATLPVDRRPVKIHHFGVASNDTFGVCRVQSDGGIYATLGQATGWYSLDGISFSVSP